MSSMNTIGDQIVHEIEKETQTFKNLLLKEFQYAHTIYQI